MCPPEGLEDTPFNFLEANLSQIHCGLLPDITNFNFSGLQMMSDTHFIPRPRKLYVLMEVSIETSMMYSLTAA